MADQSVLISPERSIKFICPTEPGVISFEKRGILVKEGAECASIHVRRKFGGDGVVSVKWRTIDETAIAGRHYVGGEGVLVFMHREVLKTIEIPIIHNFAPGKDKRFTVELFSPNNNASIGEVNRICVTITRDEGTRKENQKKITRFFFYELTN